MEKHIKLSKEKINLLLNIVGLIIFVLIPLYYFLIMQTLIILGWVIQAAIPNVGGLGLSSFWIGVFFYIIVTICRRGASPIKKFSIKICVMLVMIIGILIYSSTPLILLFSGAFMFGFGAMFIGGFGLLIAVMALELLLTRESEHYKRQKNLSLTFIFVGFLLFLLFALFMMLTTLYIFEFTWIFPLLGLTIGMIGFANWPSKKREKMNVQ